MSAPGSDLIFPPFSSLPLDKNGPPRNAWGRFGPSDELGMLNLLTPELVAAAAKEIKTGESISLDLPMDHFRYPFFNRERFEWKVKNWAEPPHLTRINDDVLTFNTQSSTQWDGFRHFAHVNDGRFWNGRSPEEVLASHALGVDAWARNGGVVGRGVLIDHASWAAAHNISRPYFESVGIPLAELKAAAEEQQATFRPGDILIVRSGFGKAFNSLSADEQKALSERPKVEVIGVDSSEEIIRWLWEHQFAAVVGDAVGFEQSPPNAPGSDPECILHNVLISGWGMPIGELFDLEGLAETCKRLKRSSFFFSSVPLKVPGGIASPPNAIAIF